MKILICILALLTALSSAALRAETPEEFSDRYMQALRDGGLNAVTGFLHPDEAKKLGDLIIELSDLSEKAGQKLPFLEPGDTAASLRKLPPEKLAERFFGFVQKAAPQITQMLRTAKAKPIGHLVDGETLYVVTKLSFEFEGEPITATDVLPLRKMNGDYKVLLKAEMGNILRGMKKQLQAK